MNHDQMTNANPTETAQASFRLLDAVQHIPQAQRPLAVAAVFLLLVETTGLQAQDVFTYSKNLINHTDGTLRPEFRAIRQYMENEL